MCLLYESQLVYVVWFVKIKETLKKLVKTEVKCNKLDGFTGDLKEVEDENFY